jgi:hypothetical protein
MIPTPAHGYPVVGLTDWILSQCYKNGKVADGLIDFLTAHFDGRFNSVSSAFGYVPASYLLGGYLTQIKNVFLNGRAGYNLNINNKTACHKLGR